MSSSRSDIFSVTHAQLTLENLVVLTLTVCSKMMFERHIYVFKFTSSCVGIFIHKLKTAIYAKFNESLLGKGLAPPPPINFYELSPFVKTAPRGNFWYFFLGAIYVHPDTSSSCLKKNHPQSLG